MCAFFSETLPRVRSAENMKTLFREGMLAKSSSCPSLIAVSLCVCIAPRICGRRARGGPDDAYLVLARAANAMRASNKMRLPKPQSRYTPPDSPRMLDFGPRLSELGAEEYTNPFVDGLWPRRKNWKKEII